VANTIKPKRSYTASATPTLAAGELAIQAADKKVFIGNSAGTGNILVASLNGADITGTVASATSATTATSATSATTATNLAGGGAGQLPYQSASGTTAMLAAGTSGQVLTSGGAAAPTWGNVLPSGSIQMFGGSSAPSGWLLCDGSSVSSTNYLALHAVISNTYGGSAYTGGAGLSFNLPDLRGRFPMGAGTGTGLNSSGTGAPSGTAQTARTRGQWGGEETHLLSISEMPSHSHNLTTYAASSGASGYRLYDRFGDATNVIGTTSAGGDARHATIPPFVVLNFIIKT
jgi:microcystin-dependent protein